MKFGLRCCVVVSGMGLGWSESEWKWNNGSGKRNGSKASNISVPSNIVHFTFFISFSLFLLINFKKKLGKIERNTKSINLNHFWPSYGNLKTARGLTLGFCIMNVFDLFCIMNFLHFDHSAFWSFSSDSALWTFLAYSALWWTFCILTMRQKSTYRKRLNNSFGVKYAVTTLTINEQFDIDIDWQTDADRHPNRSIRRPRPPTSNNLHLHAPPP
jgi:hypothetical protein